LFEIVSLCNYSNFMWNFRIILSVVFNVWGSVIGGFSVKIKKIIFISLFISIFSFAQANELNQGKKEFLIQMLETGKHGLFQSYLYQCTQEEIQLFIIGRCIFYDGLFYRAIMKGDGIAIFILLRFLAIHESLEILRVKKNPKSQTLLDIARLCQTTETDEIAQMISTFLSI